MLYYYRLKSEIIVVLIQTRRSYAEKIPVPVVPFTLQLLFTMTAGLLLGGKLVAASVGAYILIGLLGLPVFAEGGGPAYILKPSFGYIIGFAAASFSASNWAWMVFITSSADFPLYSAVSGTSSRTSSRLLTSTAKWTGFRWVRVVLRFANCSAWGSDKKGLTDSMWLPSTAMCSGVMLSSSAICGMRGVERGNGGVCVMIEE